MRTKFPNKVILYLIELPICHSVKCKMKFTGHWLRYSTTPNVPTLFTPSSHANNLAFIFFAASFTLSLHMF